MLEYLKKAGWIVAFVVVCAFWGIQVMNASRPHDDGGIWICPILGKCGPAGTPGLGKW